MRVTEDATVTSKGTVTIPKRIRDALGVEAGTEVKFVLEEDGSLRVRLKRPAMERLHAVKEQLAKHDVDLEKMRRDSKEEWSSHYDEPT